MAEVYVSTDVEADGPIPGPNSMLSFGSAAYTAEKTLVATFEANLTSWRAHLATPWEPRNLEAYTRDWCRRWSKCAANFIAVFWSATGLFDGKKWFDESLTGFQFQQLLVWHANNSGTFQNRKWFKQSWQPIYLYRRVSCDRLIVAPNKPWSERLHNLDCFVAPVPQTNYNGHDLKQHETQKPVSVMKWLIHALSEPGEKVVSLFCGVAPCGIAAVQMGRRYYGVETNRKYRQIAERRLVTYGVVASESDL